MTGRRLYAALAALGPAQRAAALRTLEALTRGRAATRPRVTVKHRRGRVHYSYVNRHSHK